MLKKLLAPIIPIGCGRVESLLIRHARMVVSSDKGLTSPKISNLRLISCIAIHVFNTAIMLSAQIAIESYRPSLIFLNEFHHCGSQMRVFHLEVV